MNKKIKIIAISIIIISIILLITIGVINYYQTHNSKPKSEKEKILEVLNEKFGDKKSVIKYSTKNEKFYIFIKINKKDGTPIETYSVNKNKITDITVSSVIGRGGQ